MLPYPISVAARRQLLEGRWWCRDPIGGHRPRRHLSTQILPYPAMAPRFARTAGQFDALRAPLGPQWRTRHGTPTQSADRRIGSCTRRAKLDQLLVVRPVQRPSHIEPGSPKRLQSGRPVATFRICRYPTGIYGPHAEHPTSARASDDASGAHGFVACKGRS